MPIYQLFGYNLAKIQLTSYIQNNFALDFALIVTKQLINKQNWKIFLISSNILLASPAMQEIRKRNNSKYLEKWEIFSILLIYLWFLVTIKAKSNAKSFSMMMPIEFWPNCNQTADKLANLKNISYSSKYLILFLLGIYYLADISNRLNRKWLFYSPNI